MIFIFKKQKLVLDCFTFDKKLYDFYRIDKASNFYPNWFKNLDKDYDDKIVRASTIKRCVGILDTYQKGFIIPMWSDLNIKITDGSYEWLFAYDKTMAMVHDYRQWSAYVSPLDYGHLKINSIWRIKSKKDTKFYFTHPYWNHNPINTYSIIPGMLNFKYQSDTNINMFFDLKQNKIIEIKQGTPMIHLMPLTDKEIVLKHHLISFDEYHSDSSSFSFHNSYLKQKKMIDDKEKKCPFNFK
jgi:hypothetical protein